MQARPLYAQTNAKGDIIGVSENKEPDRGSDGATANVGEDDEEKQNGVTPVNEKNKKNISKSSYGKNQ